MTELLPTALPVADRATTRRWAIDLVARRKRSVAIVLGLLVVTTVAFAGIPAIVGAAVEIATTDGDRDDLRWLVLAMALIIVVGVVGVVTGRYEAARFGESVLDELRTRVYDATISLPSATVESVGVGELVARATGDVETLSSATRNSLPAVLFSSIVAVGMAAALIVVDYRLALAGLGLGALVAAWGVRWYIRHAPGRYRHERQADSDRSASLLEHYSGRSTIWSFGATDVSVDALESRGEQRFRANLSTTAARNRLRPALRVGQAAALGMVVGLGAYLLDQGSLSAGALTASSLYMIRLIDPVTTLLEELDELQNARAALERIAGLIELSEAQGDRDDWPPVPSGNGGGRRRGLDVELASVSFGYAPGLPVMEGVDLRVSSGQWVMVVGPSGAGKSTLAGLACGTHRPWSGTIRIGGADIAGVRRDELRQRIALVAQETHVFARSIRDNVALGRADATDDEIVAALEAADAWSWVSDLDDGLATMVSNSHPTITPARAQQLNLARIICLDPPVIMLDEATADLDPGSAGRAERRLRAALDGRTVISIAHRLDAAPTMDRVVMVSDGQIVADGSHDELVQRAGPYADLWNTWRRTRSDDPEPAS